jgi:hypothetical protein
LTSNKFCRKKPCDEEKIKMEAIIKSFIDEERPLRLAALFGGYKNPTTGLTNPDLAEIKTLERLDALLNKLRAIYSHGAELYLVTTGKKGEIANGISPEKTFVYEEKISKIAGNFKKIKVVPIGSLYKKFFNNGNLEEMLRREKEKAELLVLTDKELLAEKIKIAEKHNSLPLSTTNGESRDKAIESALAYSILSDQEPKILSDEFRAFIKLSFRTKGENGAISLFTCRKGVIHQPWNNACTKCMHRDRCFAESKSGKIIYC